MKVMSVAAIYMLLGVACGAFGAHALRDHITPQDLAIWEKAVLYHLIHALAAVTLGLSGSGLLGALSVDRIVTLLLASVTVFSGSLYLLVLTNIRWLGMITPLGGVGFMLAWATLAHKLWKSGKSA